MAKRTSKYEPYKKHIVECLSKGMTYKQTCDYIENLEYDLSDEIPIFDTSSLGEYCRKNDILNQVTQGCRYERVFVPKCETCEHMKMIKNCSNQDSYLCQLSNRIATKEVKTSPKWCEKRKVDNNVKYSN